MSHLLLKFFHNSLQFIPVLSHGVQLSFCLRELHRQSVIHSTRSIALTMFVVCWSIGPSWSPKRLAVKVQQMDQQEQMAPCSLAQH